MFSNTSLIVAYDQNRVIGKGNSLPWNIPSDLKWFKERTINNSVIMGYNTYKSIGKPLPDRLNIVLSSKKRNLPKEVLQAYNLQEACYIAQNNNNYNKEIFFIGGEQVYSQVIPTVKNLYITEIKKKFKGNKFFPELDFNDFKEVRRIKNKEEGIEFDFVSFKRTSHETTKT
jgi:dihydrofolate reductase